jgi:hypothetical protein
MFKNTKGLINSVTDTIKKQLGEAFISLPTSDDGLYSKEKLEGDQSYHHRALMAIYNVCICLKRNFESFKSWDRYPRFLKYVYDLAFGDAEEHKYIEWLHDKKEVKIGWGLPQVICEGTNELAKEMIKVLDELYNDVVLCSNVKSSDGEESDVQSRKERKYFSFLDNGLYKLASSNLSTPSEDYLKNMLSGKKGILKARREFFENNKEHFVKISNLLEKSITSETTLQNLLEDVKSIINIETEASSEENIFFSFPSRILLLTKCFERIENKMASYVEQLKGDNVNKEQGRTIQTDFEQFETGFFYDKDCVQFLNGSTFMDIMSRICDLRGKINQMLLESEANSTEAEVGQGEVVEGQSIAADGYQDELEQLKKQLEKNNRRIAELRNSSDKIQSGIDIQTKEIDELRRKLEVLNKVNEALENSMDNDYIPFENLTSSDPNDFDFTSGEKNQWNYAKQYYQEVLKSSYFSPSAWSGWFTKDSPLKIGDLRGLINDKKRRFDVKLNRHNSILEILQTEKNKLDQQLTNELEDISLTKVQRQKLFENLEKLEQAPLEKEQSPKIQVAPKSEEDIEPVNRDAERGRELHKAVGEICKESDEVCREGEKIRGLDEKPAFERSWGAKIIEGIGTCLSATIECVIGIVCFCTIVGADVGLGILKNGIDKFREIVNTIKPKEPLIIYPDSKNPLPYVPEKKKVRPPENSEVTKNTSIPKSDLAENSQPRFNPTQGLWS